MSTRSSISVQVGDSVKTIYCHFDGYKSHHVPILDKYYNSQELAEKLISLGDLSSLDISADCPEGHTFDTPIEGYCVAYGRDRKEKDIEARVYWNIKMALLSEKQEYNYFWDGKSWSLV